MVKTPRSTHRVYASRAVEKYHGQVTGVKQTNKHVKLSDASLGIRPRDSLVADEDVKIPTKQTNKQTRKVAGRQSWDPSAR